MKQKPFHDRLRSRQELLAILLKHCPEQLGIHMNQINSSPVNDQPFEKKSTGPRFSILQQASNRTLQYSSVAPLGFNTGPPKRKSVFSGKPNY